MGRNQRSVPASAWLLSGLIFAAARALAQDTRPAARPAPPGATRPADLLVNGDFELRGAAENLPAGWTTRHPANVRLVDGGPARGLVVEMAGQRKLMGSYGVDLTSARIPIKPDTRYRCTGLTRSDGPHLKVFVKGYATVTRRVAGRLKTFQDVVYQVRKDLDPSAEWRPFKLDFQIVPARVFSDFQHRIAYVRIHLWAYWPAGRCWFDEIRFQELGPLPASQRRHPAPVTHLGLAPRLGPASRPASGAFDARQTWRDAVNAFRSGDGELAARLAAQLVEHAPGTAAYRLLAARALAAAGRWRQAERQANWLLEAARLQDAGQSSGSRIQPWQRDWARLVRAQACFHTGRRDQARRILQLLLDTPGRVSPHAREAARQLRARIEADDR